MRNIIQNFGTAIGVISQINNDRELLFVGNNSQKCSISDIVGVQDDKNNFILAQVSDIKIEFYLENTKQFFISKAVENSVHLIGDPNNKPRFGQFVTAKILGFYQINSKGIFIELKDYTNNYTCSIFQEVYLIETEKAFRVYGLSEEKQGEKIPINEKTIRIGTLSFPRNTNNKENSDKPIFIEVGKFKNHTLITGVTGSGKSRLAALLMIELANIGAHISILDPHDEYSDLVAPHKKDKLYIYSQIIKDDINKYGKNVLSKKISFYEQINSASTLSKLFPTLSDQQEVEIFEIFNELGQKPTKPQVFINKLIDKLNIELKSEPRTNFEEISQIQKEAEQYSKNHIEFIDIFTSRLMALPSYGRAKKKDVIIALIRKINELRKNNLLDKDEPNWLLKSPFTIDIFNIDYSTNDYIKRFVNSIIQHFLREKSSDELRVLFIDEAHLLLNEGTDTSYLVKQLLREARKFNLSIVFISQNTDDIPPEIRNQFQNIFIFREKDIETTRFYPNQLCSVNIFDSKSSFAMKVNNLDSFSEIQKKINS